MCKMCETNTSSEFCSYECERHYKCVQLMENGSDSDIHMARNAMRRFDVMNPYTGVLDKFDAKRTAINNNRLALLSREKATDDKGELRDLRKLKAATNAKKNAYQMCYSAMNTWNMFGMFDMEREQHWLRTWRLDWMANKELIDEEDRAEYEEILTKIREC